MIFGNKISLKIVAMTLISSRFGGEARMTSIEKVVSYMESMGDYVKVGINDTANAPYLASSSWLL
jgi:hypothetical protein